MKPASAVSDRARTLTFTAAHLSSIERKCGRYFDSVYQGHALGVIEEMRQFVRRVENVDRHHDRPDLAEGEPCDEEFRAIGKHDRYGLARLHAFRGQMIGQAIHAPGKFTIGEGRHILAVVLKDQERLVGPVLHLSPKHTCQRLVATFIPLSSRTQAPGSPNATLLAALPHPDCRSHAMLTRRAPATAAEAPCPGKLAVVSGAIAHGLQAPRSLDHVGARGR